MLNYHRYLSTTPQEKAWGFYVTTAGYSKVSPRQTYPQKQGHPNHAFTWNKGRILDGYYVVYISKGRGTFESAFTDQTTLEAGTCFCLFPGVWHRYKPDAQCGWEEYWIGFKGTYPDRLMRQGFFSPDKPFVQTGLHEPLSALFQKVLDEIRGSNAGYHQVISGIALQILGLLHAARLGKHNPENEADSIIAKARFILRESPESARMEDITRELGIGYSKFRKLFKEVTGQSPHQYRLSLKLERAKELLNMTSLSVSEIAYETGFNSVFYFSRLFKKKNRVSPASFRRNASYPKKVATKT
ncbi:MAG TPA: AraC family transcriptional regulator [Ohtaekwangia sp.]|nr:AraC family transcriptional regulator [Ohtaekwangia sp.]